MSVTVLVPTHLRNDMLREALDSLIAQTYTDWHALVADNGGDARKVVESYGDERLTYQWFPEMTSMAHGTRFRGLWDSDGYGCQLHDDDLLTPDSISKRVAYLDTHDCGLVFTAMMAFGDSEGSLPAPIDHFTDEYRECVSRRISTPSAMWRNSVRRDYEPDFDSHGADGLWVYRMHMGGVGIGYLDEPLYCYRDHSGQESRVWLTDSPIPSEEYARILEVAESIREGRRDPKQSGLW